MKINLNFKKILKWIVLILLFLIVLIIIVIKFFPDKNEFQQILIPEIQVQEHKKWQLKGQTMVDRTYSFYGLNGLGYYQKELKKEKQKPAKEQNSSLISLLKYRCQTQKEPTDLLLFINEPFRKWGKNDIGESWFGSGIVQINEETIFNQYVEYIACQEFEGCLWFWYDGPQYILEEDKDYYIVDVWLPYNHKNQSDYRYKRYHLYFNPVRKTLSVYKNKFNIK
ncbi:hypothetical protein [Candidatus Phytoplasma sacchari]|uniref:Uncharacterized protein n=1 Tax=Candidatus Phytoplasma sacchari TaxID=2609813 RepID=A0ABY7M3X3_9MOLU|nr:hypothetical protein O7R10_01735 [Candidatus Phytoplasma sacchari]